ncbi:MAG: archaetidylserine decarboxylase [bacterium]
MDIFFKFSFYRCYRLIVSFFVSTKFPFFLQKFLQFIFFKCIRFSPLNTDTSIKVYPSLQDFFTREAEGDFVHDQVGVFSPVEAMIQCQGTVQSGQVLQAKGLSYELSQLIPSDLGAKFEGATFATLYLAPTDCHRIYAPLTGKLLSVHHIAGHFWPVRQPWLQRVPGLYAQNERVIGVFDLPSCMLVMVMVAAFNVGSITVCFEPYSFRSTTYGDYSMHQFPSPILLTQGQHMATFHLGSTVILFCQPKPGFTIASVKKTQDKLFIGDSLFSLNQG